MKKKTARQITEQRQEWFNGTTQAIRFLETVGVLYKKAKTDEARKEITDKARQAEMIIYNNKGRF